MKRITFVLYLTIVSLHAECFKEFSENKFYYSDGTFLTNQEITDLYKSFNENCPNEDIEKPNPIIKVQTIEKISKPEIREVLKMPINKGTVKKVHNSKKIILIRKKKVKKINFEESLNGKSKLDLYDIAYENAKKGNFLNTLKVWKFSAAVYNDPYAMKNIAILYKNGFGKIERSYELFKFWMKKAMKTKYKKN
jgi:hypothetical protein